MTESHSLCPPPASSSPSPTLCCTLLSLYPSWNSVPMALPGSASSSAPLLLGAALLLLLGLAGARTIVSSSAAASATTTGALHAGNGRAKRAQVQLAAFMRAKAAQSGTTEPKAANATSSTVARDYGPWSCNGLLSLPVLLAPLLVAEGGGKAVLADPNAPIEWQALLRMQAGWAYQYTDWTPLNPCSNWTDITCTGGHVTAFHPEEYLQGPLSTDFGTLLYLTYFLGHQYYIGGPIPTNIGNLRALVHFALYSSSVSGPIPPSMGLCTLLTYLNLVENGGLTGIIPSTLGNLELVSDLYLYNNQFTGFGEIGNAGTMPNLERLDMSYNLLTNVPSSFYKLVSLTYISQYNNLVVALPTALSKMTQVQEIYLEYNRLVGILPSWISSLPGLTYIDLSFNYLTGSIGTPASSSNYFQFNFFTSGSCYAGNCQQSCTNQRLGGPSSACARFCGADEPNGVCGGKGTCVPGIPLNTCICPGFGSRQQCNNNVCVCT